MSAALVAACAAGGAVAGAAWTRLAPIAASRSPEAEEQTRGYVHTLSSTPALASMGAIACGAAAWRFGWSAALAPALALCFVLLGVVACDLRYRVIPNRLTGPAALLGYLLVVAVAPDRWLEHLIAALLAGAALFLAAVLSPGGLGMGDVKLAALLGAFLGSTVAVAVFAGMLLAAVPSILLLVVHGRRAGKVAFALGPFLAVGGVVALIAGDDIMRWYMA